MKLHWFDNEVIPTIQLFAPIPELNYEQKEKYMYYKACAEGAIYGAMKAYTIGDVNDFGCFIKDLKEMERTIGIAGNWSEKLLNSAGLDNEYYWELEFEEEYLEF